MTLENKLKQIENELTNAQQDLETTTKRLEDKEKSLTNVCHKLLLTIQLQIQVV